MSSSHSFPDAVRDMLITKGRMPPPEPPQPEVVVASVPTVREVAASLAVTKSEAEPPVAPQDDLEGEPPSFGVSRAARANWRRARREEIKEQSEVPLPSPRAVGRPQLRVVR